MGKQRKYTSAGKELFVSALLEMLDSGTGLRELNLRKVARRIGCAHTNAYNYVASWEELIWWALKEALERMIAPTLEGEKDPFEASVDFALNHPGWYRLIWLEPLSEPPPQEVLDYLPEPANLFTRELQRMLVAYRGKEPEIWADPLEQKARILHAYLHGELSSICSGRSMEDSAKSRQMILADVRFLFQKLFETP